MAVIKSWGNAWITTERFHESERLPCVFGCGGKDKTSHYFLCDHLWTLLIGCIVPRTSPLYSSTDPRVKVGIRLCLISPSPLNIALCMVAFKVYHAIKQDYRLEVNRAIALEDFQEILDIAHELILHLTKEFNLCSSVVRGSQTVHSVAKNVPMLAFSTTRHRYDKDKLPDSFAYCSGKAKRRF